MSAFYYVLLLLCFITASHAINPHYYQKGIHFQEWYPQFGEWWQNLLQQNCSQELHDYTMYDAPRDNLGLYIQPVITCLLEKTEEWRKANMVGAAVVLGLLPTTLCLVGSNTTETGVLAMFRPFLSLLLAAGAPAVNPLRSFETIDPIELLDAKPRSKKVERPEWLPLWAISTLEYTVAGAAIANLGLISHDLSLRTIVAFVPESAFLPALWATLSLLVHVVGAIAIYLRVKAEFQIVSQENSLAMRRMSRISPRYGRLTELVIREVTPSVSSLGSTFKLKDESYWFIFFTWAVPTGTVLHILFGTLVFSSLLFISTQDAIIVCARYLASTLSCRIIVMYELSGLRATVEVMCPDCDSPFPSLRRQHVCISNEMKTSYQPRHSRKSTIDSNSSMFSRWSDSEAATCFTSDHASTPLIEPLSPLKSRTVTFSTQV